MFLEDVLVERWQHHHRSCGEFGQERIGAGSPLAGRDHHEVDFTAEAVARLDEGLVQFVPVGAPDHQQVDVVRGGDGLAGRFLVGPDQLGAEYEGCALPERRAELSLGMT